METEPGGEASGRVTREKPRVGIIMTHAAPYRDATFAMLHSDAAYDLHVLFMFNREEGRSHWNPGELPYPHQYLGRYVTLHRYSVLHLHLIRALKRGRYDVLFIPCHNDMTALLTAAYAVEHGIPLIYSADTVEIHPLFEVRSRLRNGLVKWLLRKSKAVWVPGLASREYMLRHGVPPSKIFQGSYTLDVDHLMEAMGNLEHRKPEIRRLLGIEDGATVFLMVANMIRNRRHVLLLKSFERLSREHNVFLILAGDGPERQRVEEFCSRRRIRNVKLYRQLPFDDLKYYYTAGDAYVHTGHEPYSTALDYGAIAGLPLVTTTAVGAARNYPDMFQVFPLTDPDDVDGLFENMRRIVVSPALAKETGRKFRDRIRERNTRWAADQLKNAIHTALYGRTGIQSQ